MGGNARLRSGKSAVKMYDLDASAAVGGGGKMTPNNVSQYLRERGCITVSFITSLMHAAAAKCELKTLLRSVFSGYHSSNEESNWPVHFIKRTLF